MIIHGFPMQKLKNNEKKNSDRECQPTGSNMNFSFVINLNDMFWHLIMHCRMLLQNFKDNLHKKGSNCYYNVI